MRNEGFLNQKFKRKNACFLEKWGRRTTGFSIANYTKSDVLEHSDAVQQRRVRAGAV
jgi:hypothetical protein